MKQQETHRQALKRMLSPDDYDRAIVNMKQQRFGSRLEKMITWSDAGVLGCSFDWKTSNEGFEYWNNVCDRLGGSDGY